MKPPLLARALLMVAAGAAEAEFVAGDLEEEFVDLCDTQSRSVANRWYLRQVVRSVLPLLGLRVRSGELSRLLLSAFAGVALPLLLLDRLWCFVYSQIPLKDGLDRASAFLAVNTVLVCACAAIAGFQSRSMERASATAVATAISAGLAMWAATGSAPVVYAVLVLVLAPASSIIGVVWRRTV